MSDPRGLYCPHCHGIRLMVSATKRPQPGVKIRYRQCSACGTKVKTTERITTVYKPVAK